MSKPMALFFAIFSIVLMSATAISISYSVWLVLLFSLLTLGSIGAGFVVNAKMRRRRQG